VEATNMGEIKTMATTFLDKTNVALLFEGKNCHLGKIFKLRVHSIIEGIFMSVVEIDERGRMTVPKKLGLRKSRAIIIPAGSFFVTIPLPKAPQKEAEKWLDTSKEHKELKSLAEKAASEDAVNRAKRRHQL
jgi:bifunctional DNA-binding transcriptional regulator/antitoxin component of YhaV-PrlF toxin-antitoxin module